MKNVLLMFLVGLLFVGCGDDPVSPEKVEFVPLFYPEVGKYLINESVNKYRKAHGLNSVNYIDSVNFDNTNNESLYLRVKGNYSNLPINSNGKWFIEKGERNVNIFRDFDPTDEYFNLRAFENATGYLILLKELEADSIDCYILNLIRSIEVNGNDTTFNIESWVYIEQYN